MRFPQEGFKRIGKSVGTELSEDVIEALDEHLVNLAESIAEDALRIARHSQRTTVMAKDIKYSC